MQNTHTSGSIRRLALDGIFTAVLVILGMIKLPSLIPGAEFQLSAPYAVCLAAAVGFKRYLGTGICSSAIQLLLGTHTVWNVLKMCIRDRRSTSPDAVKVPVNTSFLAFWEISVSYTHLDVYKRQVP